MAPQVANAERLMQPPIGCASIYNYRNKMTFSCSGRRWEPTTDSYEALSQGFALGLLKPGSHTEVLPVSDCSLQDATANEILRFVSGYCENEGLPPYDPASRTGVLRNLTIRRGRHPTSGQPEYMVLLITHIDASENPKVKDLADALSLHVPSIAGVLNSVAEVRPGALRFKRHVLLAGRGTISETLCGLNFLISPDRWVVQVSAAIDWFNANFVLFLDTLFTCGIRNHLGMYAACCCFQG